MTLADLAAATGLSRATLSRLESGEREVSMESLQKLATAFGITPALLMFLASDEGERGPLEAVGQDLDAIIIGMVRRAA